MKIGAIQFPESILAAIRDGRLVVFAGAGVSMGEPANLPSFGTLAEMVASGTGERRREDEPEDRFLGRLNQKRIDVHTIAARILSNEKSGPTPLHYDLLRLYSAAAETRIVTTNFDLLFEKAVASVHGGMPEIFRAPALPLGRSFRGIVHVHGSVDRPYEMVLTDADFGRAYLTEGWARRFLADLFRNCTVLFVGYRHKDVIVSYLARALPAGEVGRRFAITPNHDDPQHWRALGVEPIIYPLPRSADHSLLNDGVKRLADLVRRNTLDWQTEIKELASRPPPLEQEAADIIDDALGQVETTRFFVASARHSDWIRWLDTRKRLNFLFKDGDLGECERILVWWLAENFATQQADLLFLLIAKYGTRLNPFFWHALGREVSVPDRPELKDETLLRWISLLLATAATRPDKTVLSWLGERCQKRRLTRGILDIFESLASSYLELKQGNSLFDDEKEGASSPQLDVEAEFVGDHYELNELWKKGLKLNLAELSDSILTRSVKKLEEHHLLLAAWNKASRDWSSASFRRSAIEPHDQDEYPEAIDVLIDAARDSLEAIMKSSAGKGRRWIEHLSSSEEPLLRRLAAHGMSVRNDVSADEKLSWLLDNFGLHDTALHHETYRLVKLTYPGAGQASRQGVIEAVQAYRWPNEEDAEKERRTARVQYEWLNWISNAAPGCALVHAALGDIKKKYPKFEPSDHPDLTHWTSSGWTGPVSPWTADQLLSNSGASQLSNLVTFKGDSFRGPDRAGLLGAVAEAAKKSPGWGLELANELAPRENWEVDLWQGLISAWSEANLSEAEYETALKLLSRIELLTRYPRPIADFLYALVRSGGKPYAIRVLPNAHQTAIDLWRSLDRTQEGQELASWLQRAINNPAGKLAQFWLHGLSLWRQKHDPKPEVIDENYRSILTDVLREPTTTARLAKSVIASQFTFLFSADPTWTTAQLVPLFSGEREMADFRAAWDGFSYWGRLTPAVAERLETSFLFAAERVDAELTACSDRFVDQYTTLLVHYANDVVGKWIPALFKAANEKTRARFTWSIEAFLRKLDDAAKASLWQRWLKDYWGNRILGVPQPLLVREIEGMLGWLPHLSASYSEGVAIAIHMPAVPLQHSSLIHELAESQLSMRYPEATARLLMYLSTLDAPAYIWHRGEKLISRLCASGLPQHLENGLREIAARFGFNLTKTDKD